MQFKKNKLLQGGILIFIIAAVFFFFENQTEFVQTDYSQKYFQHKTKELSLFEIGDGWRGNFTYDTERAVEGKTSMTLTSWYGADSYVSLAKTIPLDEYTKGYVLVYVKNKQELAKIENVYLELSEGSNKQEYSIIKELIPGWNRVAFMVPKWKKIENIKIGIASRPQVIAEINIDRMWIENTDAYSKDLLTQKPTWLSLRTIGERTYLYSFSPELVTYSLSQPSSIRSGTITVGLIPERAKTIRFGVNGTDMNISGDNMKTCVVNTNGKPAVRKLLRDTSGGNDYFVFLRATLNGNDITYSVSNNGLDYEECGTADRARKEPITLSLDGSYLIDSIQAEYLD